MIERGITEFLKESPLSRLNILVHPLFLADYPQTEQYERATEDMKVQALRRFVPSTESDFLLVMPHQKERTKPNPKWMTFFYELKDASPIEDNVQLLSDILTAHGSYRRIDQKLLQYEKAIDANTEIYIGGEYTDNCVESVAKMILQNTVVSQVIIDTRVAVYSDSETRHILPKWNGVDIRKDQDRGYIQLKKVRPT